MLLYFSATGNCKYVAQRLAAAYNEKAISILDCLHQEQYDFSESTIGIVFPTYFWGLPSLVQEFLEKASFQTAIFILLPPMVPLPERPAIWRPRPYAADPSTLFIP